MARFCPYCGRPMSERSKFCPQCGKAMPERQRRTAVAVEGTPRAVKPKVEGGQTRAAAPQSPTPQSSAPQSSKPQVSPDLERTHPYGSQNRARPIRAPNMVKPAARRGNGAASLRFAPATHSLIGSFEQAGFGLRYGAWMFDFLITLIAIMTFTFIVTAVSQRAVVNSNRDLLIVGVLTLLLFVLNFVVLAGVYGQSAGMRILGIHIARVDGRPFSIKDAALRHLVGYPLSSAAFFLGFLWMLWDPRQQGWHDKLARTIVVMSR